METSVRIATPEEVNSFLKESPVGIDSKLKTQGYDLTEIVIKNILLHIPNYRDNNHYVTFVTSQYDNTQQLFGGQTFDNSEYVQRELDKMTEKYARFLFHRGEDVDSSLLALTTPEALERVSDSFRKQNRDVIYLRPQLVVPSVQV